MNLTKKYSSLLPGIICKKNYLRLGKKKVPPLIARGSRKKRYFFNGPTTKALPKQKTLNKTTKQIIIKIFHSQCTSDARGQTFALGIRKKNSFLVALPPPSSLVVTFFSCFIKKFLVVRPLPPPHPS